MAKKSRFAEFKERHNLETEDVVVFSFMAATAVAFTGLFAWAIREDVKESKRVDEWSNTQYEAGRHVYQLSNGSLIATDKIYVY